MFDEPMGYRSEAMDAGYYAREIVRATQRDVPRADVARMAESRFGVEAAGPRLLDIWTDR